MIFVISPFIDLSFLAALERRHTFPKNEKGIRILFTSADVLGIISSLTNVRNAKQIIIYLNIGYPKSSFIVLSDLGIILRGVGEVVTLWWTMFAA